MWLVLINIALKNRKCLDLLEKSTNPTSLNHPINHHQDTPSDELTILTSPIYSYPAPLNF